MNLAYPYQFAPNGRTAQATDPVHIRDLIEQVLFTAPGERVMHPDFGSGAAQRIALSTRCLSTISTLA